jgi:hypothetical protein
VGRAKDRLIEEEERGWYSVSEKLVCDSCIEDTYLSDHITRNGRVAVCGYCGLDPEEADVRCVPFDELMALIGDGLNWAYRSADNEGIPYESAEGGYAFGESMLDSYDLVTDEIPITASDAVLEDILAALPQQIWCRRGFWSLSLYEALKFGWSEFVEQVKYKTRYLFTMPEEISDPKAQSVIREPKNSDVESVEIFPTDIELIGPSGDPDFNIDFDRQEGIPVHEMLDAIGQLLRHLELVRTVKPGTIIYRVRVYDKGKNLEGPEELGSPAREHATQPNRMSPAGIVMFYGATKPETALLETFQPERERADEKAVWIASFRVMKELRILDLTHLPPVPSIFDRSLREQQSGISFLHAFEEDFTTPIERDGHEHIDYVPTQIVTEYVRHRFRTEDSLSVEGILYRSSKRKKGTACVLFIDGTNCGVPVEHWREPQQVLQLLEDQTKVLDGAKASEWYPNA